MASDSSLASWTGFLRKIPPTFGPKEELLGSGASGRVVKVLVVDPGGYSSLRIGEYIAVKQIVMPPASNPEDHRERFAQVEREVTMLKTLRHPHVVEYFGATLDPQQGLLSIFMEHCEGNSIRHVYLKQGPLPIKVVQRYTCQLLLGLAYLHERGVVHRDLKCLNVLLSSDGVCKLADLGCAIQLATAQPGGKPGKFHSQVGSLWWMAPEVIQITPASGASFPADIWSLGCCVWEMLAADKPFAQFAQEFALMRFVVESPTDDAIIGAIPDGLMAPEALNFVKRCLRKDPTARATAAQLLEDPFIAPVAVGGEGLGRRGGAGGVAFLGPPGCQTPVATLGDSQALAGSAAFNGSLSSSKMVVVGAVTAAPAIQKLGPAVAWWQALLHECGLAADAEGVPAPAFFEQGLRCTALFSVLLPFLKHGSATPSPPTAPAAVGGAEDVATAAVSREDWLRFVGWFGPLDRLLADVATYAAAAEHGCRAVLAATGSGYSYSGECGYYGADDAAHALFTVLKQPWFYPLLTQNEFDRVMSQCPAETFAIRFTSSVKDFPGGYTLVVKGPTGPVKFRVVRPVDSWEFVIEGLYFSSLEDMVAHGEKKGFRAGRDKVYRLMHPLMV